MDVWVNFIRQLQNWKVRKRRLKQNLPVWQAFYIMFEVRQIQGQDLQLPQEFLGKNIT